MSYEIIKALEETNEALEAELKRYREREEAVQRLAKRVLFNHDELVESELEQLIADADAVRAFGPLGPSNHVECTDSLCIWCVP